ncbi:MAG: hypothetical protein J6B87_06485 [Clostridia bacterium]|nr:hypothetical protein [Clostridia bacterium]
MEIKILHWYYDIMNLYGEYGNIKILEKHLKDQKLKVIVDRKTVNEDINLNEYDFIYIGAGTEDNQMFVMQDMMKYKEQLKEYIDSEKVALFTGNSYELLGKTIDGKETLGILDFETTTLKDRVTSDVIYKSKFLKKQVVGFVNKMSNIVHNLNPLFEVEFGIGENENKDIEGIKYKNFYGTHVSGPILVRNPEILEMLIRIICLKKDKSLVYKKREYKNEKQGYELVLSELKNRMNDKN